MKGYHYKENEGGKKKERRKLRKNIPKINKHTKVACTPKQTKEAISSYETKDLKELSVQKCLYESDYKCRLLTIIIHK